MADLYSTQTTFLSLHREASRITQQSPPTTNDRPFFVLNIPTTLALYILGKGREHTTLLLYIKDDIVCPVVSPVPMSTGVREDTGPPFFQECPGSSDELEHRIPVYLTRTRRHNRLKQRRDICDLGHTNVSDQNLAAPDLIWK